MHGPGCAGEICVSPPDKISFFPSLYLNCTWFLLMFHTPYSIFTFFTFCIPHTQLLLAIKHSTHLNRYIYTLPTMFLFLSTWVRRGLIPTIYSYLVGFYESSPVMVHFFICLRQVQLFVHLFVFRANNRNVKSTSKE